MMTKAKKTIKKEGFVDVPISWRQGQFWFNFFQWLANEKDIQYNQSVRMCDPFFLSDKDFDKYYKEFLKIQTIYEDN